MGLFSPIQRLTFMFDSDRWREIGQTLSRHKLRTALTAFGVSWGIFMLILLLGMGNGLERGIMSLFSTTSVNSVWLQGGKTSMPFQGLALGRQIRLQLSDIELLRKLPGINLIAATKIIPANHTMQYYHKSGAYEIHGINADYTQIEKLALIKGRNFNELDEQHRRKVAIIGARIAEVLFGTSVNPIGEIVTVSGIPFKVIGVYNKSLDEQNPIRFYIPLSTLSSSLDPAPAVNTIALTIKTGYTWEAIKPEATKLLARRHRFNAQDASALDSYDISLEVKKLESLLTGVHYFLLIVGIGTLLAGCVGVSNTMLVTVKERTREFGIRKAIGATPASILGMILHETLIITLGAGFIGLLAGIGLIELIREAEIESDYFRDPEVDLSVALGSLGILTFAGLVAGYLPAMQAVRILPIEALRHE